MAGRLGIIAGAGELPKRIAAHANATGREVFVLGLRGFAEKALMDAYDGAEAAMGEIGKGIRLLSDAGCKEIVFAGAIKRPDLSALKFDLRGTALIPQLAVAAGKGDDALLRVVLNAFEKAGFKVIGADDVLGSLLAPTGSLGSRAPKDSDWPDIRAAAVAALKLGTQDVAQGAIARGGLVIAREARDG
ncbi:MAG TPA: UDP-2,3-diacylglucosamine diphosphatase LpxI, partial [Hyphomonadaceae bacterium]|nr:UDP-2,3-diacylglucosamine diphosphatase LpxI [Hyphomonadaceae bacterium]